MTRGETASLVLRKPWLGAGEMTRLLKAHVPFPEDQRLVSSTISTCACNSSSGELAPSSAVQGKPTKWGRSLLLCSPVPRTVCVSLLFRMNNAEAPRRPDITSGSLINPESCYIQNCSSYGHPGDQGLCALDSEAVLGFSGYVNSVLPLNFLRLLREEPAGSRGDMNRCQMVCGLVQGP